LTWFVDCLLLSSVAGDGSLTQAMTDHLEAPETRLDVEQVRDQLRLRLEDEIATAKSLLHDLPPFVLASASPRRRELFAALDVTFTVDAADIPEVPDSGETPAQFVARAAAEKAVHVASRQACRLVLGADTVVALGAEILGKPRDRDDARRMLRGLAGPLTASAPVWLW
jgi:hypothetical protein